MEIITSLSGWEFLLRYMHFLAGVCWIGVLWYFNFIQTPFFGTELGGQAKSAVTRGLVPNALWWFRWGAMFTFLSGYLLLLWKYFLLGSGVMGDAGLLGSSAGLWISLGAVSYTHLTLPTILLV